MALRRAATASIQFLNPKTPSAAITRFAAARSCTSTTTTTGAAGVTEDSSAFNVRSNDPNVKVQMEIPYQCGGPGNVVEVDELKEGLLVRMLLPGVGENGVKVWAENNTLFFKGEGEKEYEKDDCGRRYGGTIELTSGVHKADGVEVQMKNGILRLMVPKCESKNEKNNGK